MTRRDWHCWRTKHYVRWQYRNDGRDTLATVIDRDDSGGYTGWFIGLTPLRSAPLRSDRHGPETGEKGRALAEAALREDLMTDKLTRADVERLLALAEHSIEESGGEKIATWTTEPWDEEEGYLCNVYDGQESPGLVASCTIGADAEHIGAAHPVAVRDLARALLAAWDELAAALREAHTVGYREGVEAAAKVCARRSEQATEPWARAAGRLCALDIRALTPDEPEEGA